MNVTFHALASVATAAGLSSPTPAAPSLARLGLGFLIGVAVHGVLDVTPHSYPLGTVLDVACALLLVTLVGVMTRGCHWALLVACFLGAIFPDLVDLGPAIVNKHVGTNVPVVSLFPWHWRQFSGSIYDGRQALASLSAHLLVVATSAALLARYRQRFFAPRPLVLGLTVVVLAGGAALSWRAGSALIAPASAAIGDHQLTLPHEAVVFASPSGSDLHGWFVPGAAGHGAVLLMHGVRANRLSMLGRARFLHDAGFSVLLFDFQAHGESPGHHLTFGYLEARDARAAARFLQARAPGEPLSAIGVSLGGAAAVLGDEPLPVRALVLEAVYPTIEVAVANRLALRFGAPARLLAPVVLLQLSPRLGLGPADLAPVRRIARLPCPVLIIAGAEDRHTRLADSQQLFAAAPPPKEMWIIPGAAHVDFHRYARHEYQQRVLNFLSRYAGPNR